MYKLGNCVVIIMVIIMVVGRDLGMRGLDESPPNPHSTFPDHGNFILKNLEERRLTIQNYLIEVRLVDAEDRVFWACSMHRDFVKLNI